MNEMGHDEKMFGGCDEICGASRWTSVREEDVNLSNCASSVTHFETNFIQDTEVLVPFVKKLDCIMELTF